MHRDLAGFLCGDNLIEVSFKAGESSFPHSPTNKFTVAPPALSLPFCRVLSWDKPKSTQCKEWLTG